MAETNYLIVDAQARFLIMKNFYEEVMSNMLKRFLIILNFRATGDVLSENCDILSQVLPHLPKKHTLKKEKKYRDQLFSESTPKEHLDILKFDFSMSVVFLTEMEGLPSYTKHKFCIFCEPDCKKIQLGKAEGKDCSNCGFCSSPDSFPCNFKMLKDKLEIGRKTRNTGAHTCQEQFLYTNPAVSENIDAITALYEYLYTNGNWRKFNEEWINQTAFDKIRDDIGLIKKYSITFLLEKFKKRISSTIKFKKTLSLSKKTWIK